jgi:hypothetical protein
MAVGVILEFKNQDASQYEAVCSKLGWDMKSGQAAGLLSHAAGPSDDGGFVVMEIWDSREAQVQFIQSRLGPALGEVGVSEPSRTVWVDLLSYHTH